MTALAGYWSTDGTSDPARSCGSMLRAQQIYAPSGEAAIRSSGTFALGRRLFRLLPEDVHDRDVVLGADGNIMLVADIRLDNRDDLLRSLGVPPSEGRVLADSAILMRALERWDQGAVERIVGDFAFALWDERRNRLLLARDYRGQRPLHFSHGRGFIAFASMPKGLHALEEVPRVPSRAAVAEFLALMPEKRGGSFYEGVETVPSGSFVELSRDGMRVTEYWRPDLTPIRLKSAEEYDEALREHLHTAVRSQIRGSGGRVAAHLSAGLDSSAVAATAARVLQQSGGRVTAFTSVPREGYVGPVPANTIHDEGPLAAAVAAMYDNMEHVLVRGSGRSPFQSLDRNFFLFERPVLNLCNLTWAEAINQEAKDRGLSILLTGSAGNMSFSFSGTPLLPQLLAKGHIIALSQNWIALLGNGARVGTLTSQTVGPFLPRPIWKLIQRVRRKGHGLASYTSLSHEVAEELKAQAEERGFDFAYQPRAEGPNSRILALRRFDVGNYNKGVLGGWGLDTRDPTAHRPLVEFCLRVPPEQYLAGGFARGFARRAFTGLLPAELLRQHSKGLQAPDWHEGLSSGRHDLIEQIEGIASLPKELSIFDTGHMQALVDNWPEKEWNKPSIVERYRLSLTRGVSAGHFMRKALGANR